MELEAIYCCILHKKALCLDELSYRILTDKKEARDKVCRKNNNKEENSLKQKESETKGLVQCPLISMRVFLFISTGFG